MPPPNLLRDNSGWFTNIKMLSTLDDGDLTVPMTIQSRVKQRYIYILVFFLFNVYVKDTVQALTNVNSTTESWPIEIIAIFLYADDSIILLTCRLALTLFTSNTIMLL